MEAEPWEALDVDDSDLPSLLQPCKKLRSTGAAIVDLEAAPAPVEASSVVANAFSQAPEENRRVQQAEASTSRHRAIPGPAGAVQAAMLRKNLDRANNNISNDRDGSGEEFNGNCVAISTQEYIRKAVEDTAEFDDDFSRNPWLSALQFLGAENGVVQSTPIICMKKCLSVGRVAQVVAVITSCTPNGLGGLMVSLKDPTGKIGASIHHNVLARGEFGKNFTTGAAFILREVAIFAPVRSAQYLNITLRNLVKVFSQDNGSTSKLKGTAYPLQYADPGIEYFGNAERYSKLCNIQSITAANTEHGQYTRKAVNLQNPFCGRDQPNHGVSSSINTGRKGPIDQRNNAYHKIPEDMIGTSSTSKHYEFVKARDKGGERGDSEGNLLDNTKDMTNSGMKHGAEDHEGVNKGQMKGQPVLSKGSLPQWTDEQLYELFAGDEDDGL